MRCIMREDLSLSKPEMTAFTESIVEQAALAWFESLGWSVRHGLEIASAEPEAERTDYAQVVLDPGPRAGFRFYFVSAR